MNIEETIKSHISQAFTTLFNHTLPASEISLQPTRKEFAGSYTFVTFPYAQITKKSPPDTAEALGNYLKHTKAVQDFNVVKGFLNLEISDTVWIQMLGDMVQAPQQQGRPYGFKPANGQRVTVEFSSPNTNKPLHLGHLRNNFLGYATTRILEAYGYEVLKTSIINDRGVHICKSMLAYQKFGQGETPPSSGKKGDHLVGEYYVKFDKAYKHEVQKLIDQGIPEEEAKKTAPLMQQVQTMLQQWEQGDPAIVQRWKQMNSWVYEGFDETYRKIGVTFDKVYYESDTYLLGKDVVDEGLAQGVFFKKDDGSVWIDLTDEGLDQKLVLRADGTSVYITQDLGTAELRYRDDPFDKMVYVVGNEQDYHFNVLFTILKKLGRTYADGLYHLSYGMVDLPSGKMKSREGTVVDADDLIEEVVKAAREQTEQLGKIEDFTDEQAQALYQLLGVGALKYFLLKVDPKKRMLFNPQESVQLQGNTAPFIQYTHARIAAILRKAQSEGMAIDSLPNLDTLHPAEQELIALLHEFPAKVAQAAEEYTPSVVAQYAYDLAKAYNRFYTDVSIFGGEHAEQVSFRVTLSATVAQTIKHAMRLLGIDVPERM